MLYKYFIVDKLSPERQLVGYFASFSLLISLFFSWGFSKPYTFLIPGIAWGTEYAWDVALNIPIAILLSFLFTFLRSNLLCLVVIIPFVVFIADGTEPAHTGEFIVVLTMLILCLNQFLPNIKIEKIVTKVKNILK